MRKIIDGKMYNTETAKFVGEYEDPVGQGDFRWVREELYHKKTGEFFLYGQGGPLTQYCEVIGISGRSYGEAIVPITTRRAKEWVAEYLGVDTYIELFGEPAE